MTRFYKRKSLLVEVIETKEVINAIQFDGLDLLPGWIRKLFWAGNVSVLSTGTGPASLTVCGQRSEHPSDILVNEEGRVHFLNAVAFRNNYEPVAAYAEHCVCSPTNDKPCLTCGAGLSE